MPREPLDYPYGTDGSLVAAREWLAHNVAGDGARCPCCGQGARLYQRRLNAGVSASLCLIYREAVATGQDWVHVPSLFDRLGASKIRRAGGEYAKGLLWGLLEERVGPGAQGWYRPTEQGVMFVLEQATMPEYVVVYAGDVKGTEGRQITVRESLRDEYDYEDLMSW